MASRGVPLSDAARPFDRSRDSVRPYSGGAASGGADRTVQFEDEAGSGSGTALLSGSVHFIGGARDVRQYTLTVESIPAPFVLGGGFAGGGGGRGLFFFFFFFFPFCGFMVL